MKNAPVLWLAGLLVFAASFAQAQTPVALTNQPLAIAASDPAAATQAWLATVPAQDRDRSDAYAEGGYWLILWNFLVSAAIAFLLLETRLSVRMRGWAERVTRFKSLQPAVYALPYVLLVWVLSFPLVYYSGFIREHAYGLANQDFTPWLGEQFTGLGVALVVSAISLVVLYAVFRRAPRSWWIWGTGVGVGFMIVAMMIAPVFIAPLFNTYKPLADPTISQPILALAQANQIPVRQVFEVDESRQSKRVSANVSGLFGTARIALNDNLLKQCTLPEIRLVMAHEMGHYVLNHAFKLTLYFGLFILVAFAVARLVFDWSVRKRGARWGVDGIADPAGFPLLGLIFSTVFFLLTPLTNSAVRVCEREADAFAINTAREPDGMARVALRLGVYRKLNPGPLEEFVFFDHPSGRARIRMAMDWKAAHLPAGEVGSGSLP